MHPCSPWILVLAVSATAPSATLLAAERVDFNRDVLPILSNNCFACHGPDAAARQANLRLDTRRGALAPRRGGPAIVPGQPEASRLVARIHAEGEDRMPPLDSNRELTPREIDVLETWIQQDADWSTHWAFVAPNSPEIPEDTGEHWSRTSIDRFINARLASAGLAPSGEAERRILIRRVTLDLTGLPPTPMEIDDFLADTEPAAYERVVDRLLADPAYGEHMARPWLDLARYADSQGFEKDNPRTMWRYRDWVIDAFNADMPFDEFTRQQLAGDLLDEPALAELIATGFHRNTQTNTEGGTDNEEFRSAAVIDRVNTTMSGWMGLTMGCAQCHTHKYDPIEHHEYYALYAFFNQTEDADLDDDRPFIKAPTAEQAVRLDELDQAVATFNQRLAPPDEDVQAAVEAWIAAGTDAVDWEILPPTTAGTTTDQVLDCDPDGILTAAGAIPATDIYTLVLHPERRRIGSLRLEVLPEADQPGPGRAGNGNFVINDVEVRTTAPDAPRIDLDRAEATFNQAQYHVNSAINGDLQPTSGWAIMGGTQQAQQAVFRLSDTVELEPGEGIVVTLHQTHGTRHVLHRFRLAASDRREAGIPMPTDISSIIATPRAQRSDHQSEALARHVLPRSESMATLNEQLETTVGDRDAYRDTIQSTLVMHELPPDGQRRTHLFLGGSFLNPDLDGGEIAPDTPAMLHAFPPAAPRNRLGLAHWLLQRDNPLTARVQVNRAWSIFFGTGLVSTLDDFGIQGERPSHPELLDWLALQYAGELDWSMKRLVRLIVTSAVYRQSAKRTDQARAIDPDNRLLSHAPRLRLSAEQLRDQALFVSGLLVTDRLGGPSVMPHLPDGMLPQAFTTLVLPESSGDDLHRRGLYTTWRRTGHYPSFATFDAPSREYCTVQRTRSNTPLQVLVLLNDPVFIEAAQALARRSMLEAGQDIDDRLDLLFAYTLGREPRARERDVLRTLYDAALEHAHRDSEAAHALATNPCGPLPEAMPPDDAAAMTTVCNAMLNLDEVLNRP